jgi:hypothetical protein
MTSVSAQSVAMTAERLRGITEVLERRHVAYLLGYSSENSLRQCEDNRQILPAHKAAWLESYARFRMQQQDDLARWFTDNPSPRVQMEMQGS